MANDRQHDGTIPYNGKWPVNFLTSTWGEAELTPSLRGSKVQSTIWTGKEMD